MRPVLPYKMSHTLKVTSFFPFFLKCPLTYLGSGRMLLKYVRWTCCVLTEHHALPPDTISHPYLHVNVEELAFTSFPEYRRLVYLSPVIWVMHSFLLFKSQKKLRLKAVSSLGNFSSSFTMQFIFIGHITFISAQRSLNFSYRRLYSKYIRYFMRYTIWSKP